MQGKTGATGPQGPQGVKGDTGPRGATGPQGPAGTNATTTAVATQSASGLMSAADKKLLDEISAWKTQVLAGSTAVLIKT
ncbi:hypothetical protein [Faecalibaculum rodentium]|nr:hypothetical protein [Faecalibaculum rodentium]